MIGLDYLVSTIARLSARVDLTPSFQWATVTATNPLQIRLDGMTERFLAGDPPTKGELAAASAWAHETLAPFFETRNSCDRLVAVAGTPTSVVAVRDALVPYDSSKVHGSRVTRA